MITPPKPFDMGNMALGGLGQMLESVEMVQRAWGNLSVPASMLPTVDIGELDKRIADLKAVEQWLNANLTMLRGTIQAMEIQRGTLAAVQAMGAQLGQGMESVGQAQGTAVDDMVSGAQQRATAAVEAMQRAATGSTAAPAAAQPAATPQMPALDPTAWWEMLQRNFNQVAESALAGVAIPGSNAASTKGGAAQAKRTTGSGSSKASRGAATRTGATRRSSGTGSGKAGANGKPAASRGKKGR
jgi:hypothetical protein